MKRIIAIIGLLVAFHAGAQSGRIEIFFIPPDPPFGAAFRIEFEQLAHHDAKLHVSSTPQGPRSSWPVIAHYACYPERQIVQATYPNYGQQLYFATSGDNCNGPALLEWTPPEPPDLLNNPIGLP